MMQWNANDLIIENGFHFPNLKVDFDSSGEMRNHRNLSRRRRMTGRELEILGNDPNHNYFRIVNFIPRK
jgi:hypothetical protein